MLAAAWVTAGATVGLLIGAIIAAAFAIKAFGKQAEEVSILREQAYAERREREREAEERRRAQAAQVFTWVGERPVHEGEAPRPAACVKNTSSLRRC
jgi:hypothetical protein